MDPMDCLINTKDHIGHNYNFPFSLEPSILFTGDTCSSNGTGIQDSLFFDNYNDDMDELISPLTSSGSCGNYTKEVLGLGGDEYSFAAVGALELMGSEETVDVVGAMDTMDTISSFNERMLLDDMKVLEDSTSDKVAYWHSDIALKVVIRFQALKHRYDQIVAQRSVGVAGPACDIATQMLCDWDYDGDESLVDQTPDTNTSTTDPAKHGKPGEKFNNDIDRSIEEFNNRKSNDDIDIEIRLKPNYFGLVPLEDMKRDSAYRLVGAKPRIPHSDYVNKMNKISNINSDKYFSRINIHELSHILELDDFNISLTREIEVKVLKIFQFYCKFELGSKTWIRDTNKAQRKELITKLHGYTSAWYPELTIFKLEVIIRRGSYSIMQRRLRRERRRKGARASRA